MDTECDRLSAVDRYALGELTDPERDEFEEHLFLCSQCSEALRASAIFLANARAVFREDALRPAAIGAAGFPRSGGSWLRFPDFALPIAASVALLFVAGYQGLVIIPNYRRQLVEERTPRAIPAFALHAISRGDANVFTIPGGARFFSLNFDWAGPPGDAILELKDLSGNVRASVTAKPANEFVTLLLNVSQAPPGRYILTVRSAAQGSSEAVQYPFTLQSEPH